MHPCIHACTMYVCWLCDGGADVSDGDGDGDGDGDNEGDGDSAGDGDGAGDNKGGEWC